jgi:hypothetical protein
VPQRWTAQVVPASVNVLLDDGNLAIFVRTVRMRVRAMMVGLAQARRRSARSRVILVHCSQARRRRHNSTCATHHTPFSPHPPTLLRDHTHTYSPHPHPHARLLSPRRSAHIRSEPPRASNHGVENSRAAPFCSRNAACAGPDGRWCARPRGHMDKQVQLDHDWPCTSSVLPWTRDHRG